MGVLQGLSSVIMMLSGGGLLAHAVVQIAKNAITGGLGFGLATAGVIAIIIGFILFRTNE